MSTSELPTVLPFQPARISVPRYHELVREGAFTEHDRVELLDGIVTEKVPKNPAHRTANRKCDLKLSSIMVKGWHVQNQEPITLATSEPEPDVTVVRGALEDYSTQHPAPGDIALVVEVSDTTLVTDRFKAQIYASATIPIYWIVNLVERIIEVYSEPNPDSRPAGYNRLTTYGPEDQLPVIVDGQDLGHVKVRDLLP